MVEAQVTTAKTRKEASVLSSGWHYFIHFPCLAPTGKSVPTIPAREDSRPTCPRRFDH